MQALAVHHPGDVVESLLDKLARRAEVHAHVVLTADDGALAVRLPRQARKELLAYLGCGLLCGPGPGFALAALPD